MDYKVFVTEDAEADLDNFVRYLLFVKKSEQAAKNLLDDFEITKQSLSHVAGSLQDCTNPKLKEYGYDFINPVEGNLACGYKAVGKLAKKETIIEETKKVLEKRK